MLAEEAYRVLNDEVERSNYDLILERKAKGLPTDPVLVLEADELFRKGQTFIRRGNAVAAEEGLARAVELIRLSQNTDLILGGRILKPVKKVLSGQKKRLQLRLKRAGLRL